MGKNDITILSVSFNSSVHLKRLVKNFISKTAQIKSIKFLIIDNTNGEDEALYTAFDKSNEIRIVKNKNRYKQRSLSHANALDFGMKLIDTQFTLIVDPDICKLHVLKMVQNQALNCLSGKQIPCEIDSICIHGDNKSSLATARSIKQTLVSNKLELKPLNKMKKFK